MFGRIPQWILNFVFREFWIDPFIITNDNKSKFLIQAGGCNGIDSALIIVEDLNIYTIEFKSGSQRDICPPVFIEPLFTVVKT